MWSRVGVGYLFWLLCHQPRRHRRLAPTWMGSTRQWWGGFSTKDFTSEHSHRYCQAFLSHIIYKFRPPTLFVLCLISHMVSLISFPYHYILRWVFISPTDSALIHYTRQPFTVSYLQSSLLPSFCRHLHPWIVLLNCIANKNEELRESHAAS